MTELSDIQAILFDTEGVIYHRPRQQRYPRKRWRRSTLRSTPQPGSERFGFESAHQVLLGRAPFARRQRLPRPLVGEKAAHPLLGDAGTRRSGSRARGKAFSYGWVETRGAGGQAVDRYSETGIIRCGSQGAQQRDALNDAAVMPQRMALRRPEGAAAGQGEHTGTTAPK